MAEELELKELQNNFNTLQKAHEKLQQVFNDVQKTYIETKADNDSFRSQLSYLQNRAKRMRKLIKVALNDFE